MEKFKRSYRDYIIIYPIAPSFMNYLLLNSIFQMIYPFVFPELPMPSLE